MALTDRIPYQAQIDRPKLALPGGKRLAVWVILNVEEWRIENAMPRTVLSHRRACRVRYSRSFPCRHPTKPYLLDQPPLGLGARDREQGRRPPRPLRGEIATPVRSWSRIPCRRGRFRR